ATFEISRKGQPITMSVEAMAPPEVPPRKETSIVGNNPANGAVLGNINPAVQVELGLGPDDNKGVVVLKTSQGSYASRLLRAGDVLAEINGRKINTVTDAKTALAADAGGWALTIHRNGQETRVMIR